MKLLQAFLIKQNYRIFAIGWAVFIFIISTIPNLPQPDTSSTHGLSLRYDYLFHFSAYFVLGLLIVIWQIDRNLKFSDRRYLLILLAGVIFGLVDETHQLLIPGRSFNPVDFYLNGIGFVAGFLFTYHYIIRHHMLNLRNFGFVREKLFGMNGR